jgi:DNA modification methylase
MQNLILPGDCIDVIKELIKQDVQVDSIVTDPPYEFGFMGNDWDKCGIAYNKELWALCLKILRPGGHLLAFGGCRTYHQDGVRH